MVNNQVVAQKCFEKINCDFKKFCDDPEIILPSIQLHFGPQECNGFIKHKPQKLHGLITCLKELNFNVELMPSSHLNILKVVILGYEIHRVNIKFLLFNMDCSYDVVCRDVLTAVKESANRLYKKNNIARDSKLREIYPNLSYSSESSTSIESDDLSL